jgi:hypothetical protein
MYKLNCIKIEYKDQFIALQAKGAMSQLFCDVSHNLEFKRLRDSLETPR